MKRIKRWIRRYFAFTQRETNGFLFLILLLMASVAAPFFFNPAKIHYDPAADKTLLDSLLTQLETEAAKPYAKRSKPAIQLRNFNPNSLTVAEWQQFGVNRFVAERILKYRAKAGDFRFKQDVKKIYGLPDSVYQQLYPFMQLPDAPEKATYASRTDRFNNYPVYEKRKPYQLQPFDLNTADTTELKKIRGIGSKLSLRILKYRDRLGGFHSKDQLAEVYALSPEIIDSLEKYTFVNPGYQPAQIPLNTVTFDELKVHPYLSFNVARAIIAYREQHGRYKQISDIRKIKLVSEPLFLKLQPYLSVD